MTKGETKGLLNTVPTIGICRERRKTQYIPCDNRWQDSQIVQIMNSTYKGDKATPDRSIRRAISHQNPSIVGLLAATGCARKLAIEETTRFRVRALALDRSLSQSRENKILERAAHT